MGHREAPIISQLYIPLVGVWRWGPTSRPRPKCSSSSVVHWHIGDWQTGSWQAVFQDSLASLAVPTFLGASSTGAKRWLVYQTKLNSA